MDKITDFRGKYDFLSNFYKSKVEFAGIIYNNSEAAFQSAKTLDRKLRVSFRSMEPQVAKDMGKKLTLRSDWEQIKVKVMEEIVRNKFIRNTELRAKLVATYPSYLEEGNYWHDNTWGNCTCARCKDIVGQNHLGKILMQIRDECMKGAIPLW